MKDEMEGAVTETGGKLIKLGIAMGYPVNWGLEKCVRDLIQNFYDSIGPENFWKEFMYTFGEDGAGGLKVEMSIAGHPFAYEWLCYMGGSTKTGKDGYIGKFGEGFKVVTLCLLKMGCRMTMESQGWSLEPCTYEQDVDGTTVKMLGYRVSEREDDGQTALTVKGISVYERGTLEEALLHFFSPGSGLVGKTLSEGSSYVLCERSALPMPQSGYAVRNNGILFYQYLARGELPFPLVICTKRECVLAHTSRERDVFLPCQIPPIVYEVTRDMDAKGSYIMLEYLEDEWSSLPEFHGDRYVDTETWYYAVCQLVRNISNSDKFSKKFQHEYSSTLVYLPREGLDQRDNRDIKAAKKWQRENGDKRRIVQPIFRLLGIPNLLEEYKEYMTQAEFVKPAGSQKKMANLLADTYAKIVPEYLQATKDVAVPEVMLCVDFRGGPDAFCRRVHGLGVPGKKRPKYTVEKVIMEPHLFWTGRFLAAFLPYAQQRFRAYGMDGSATMAAMITHLGAWLYRGQETVKDAWEQWDRYASEYGHEDTEDEDTDDDKNNRSNEERGAVDEN